jgi:hypothetical protein
LLRRQSSSRSGFLNAASDGVARAGTAEQQRDYIQFEQSHRFKLTWEL